jgi:hypothetical protein
VSSPTAVLTPEWIAAQRDHIYRRTPARRVQSVDEARAFVAEVGFCHFWPIKGVELPNLFHAIAGRVRPVPMEHDDPDIGKCWGWKDQSLDKRWWYYGKLLRRRATLVSLELLPAVYACTENYGGLDDYVDEYRAGTMTVEAKQIYEALLELGPLDTVRLRREARMSASGVKSRFERALVELQVGLKVLPVGVAEAGAWRYAFVYDILQRHFPGLPEQARAISRAQARRALVLQYVDDVAAAEREGIGRVFSVFRWTATELERTIGALLQEGAVREAQVEGASGPQIVSARAL